jgi:hypothetical protein
MGEREQIETSEAAAEPVAEPALAPGSQQAFATTVLRLQRAAGNRAVGTLFGNGGPPRTTVARQRFPQPQLGPPAWLTENETLVQCRTLLTRGVGHVVITEGEAGEALLHLGRLQPDSLKRVVAALDNDGLIDNMLDNLSAIHLRSRKLIEILSLRDPRKNAGLAKKYLSYGVFDWEVTDDDAEAAASLLDALPEADRKAIEDDWFQDRLKENLPGSPDYEEGIGNQLITGAVMGDFKEDPSFWNVIGQVAVGFVPYAGQLADIRDIIANLKKLNEKGWTDVWAWLALVLSVIGLIPGAGDVIKGIGKSALKGLRRGAKAAIIPLAERLLKKIVEPVFEKVLKPVVKLVREKLDDVAKRIGKAIEERGAKAAKGAEKGLAEGGEKGLEKGAAEGATDAASKAAREAIEKSADEGLEAAAEGTQKGVTRSFGELVKDMTVAVVEKLKSWVEAVFKELGEFPKIWVELEGGDLVVYGQGSKIRIIRVRIKTVKSFVVEKTEKLLELTKDRASLLKKARGEADDAVAALLRKEGIDVTEEVGERVAEILVKREFKGAKVLFRGAGSGVVDFVFEHNGKLIVCEAKGGMSRLGKRMLGPDLAAMQGTLTYLDDVISVMRRSPVKETADMGERLLKARLANEVTYVITKTGSLDSTAKKLIATLSRIVQ